MRIALLFALLVTFGVLPSIAQQSRAIEADGTKAAVTAAMHGIRAASAAGDTEKWKSLVAESCIFVEPTGRLRTREWHIPTKAATNVKTTTELTEINVHQYGDTAVLTYVETMKAEIGENVSRSVVRFTEAYNRGARGWQMILSSETPIPQRQEIKLDPALYEDFVGDYQVAPNVIGTVTREDDRLMLKGTGWKNAYELLPLSKDTFFVREFENTEITFVRDERGKVTHQLSRTNGQETVAKKLK